MRDAAGRPRSADQRRPAWFVRAHRRVAALYKGCHGSAANRDGFDLVLAAVLDGEVHKSATRYRDLVPDDMRRHQRRRHNTGGGVERHQRSALGDGHHRGRRGCDGARRRGRRRGGCRHSDRRCWIRVAISARGQRGDDGDAACHSDSDGPVSSCRHVWISMGGESSGTGLRAGNHSATNRKLETILTAQGQLRQEVVRHRDGSWRQGLRRAESLQTACDLSR